MMFLLIIFVKFPVVLLNKNIEKGVNKGRKTMKKGSFSKESTPFTDGTVIRLKKIF